jgi:ATP-dependent Clp protease adaptor protein ClpS
VPALAEPIEDTRTAEEERAAPARSWTTVVWNDPVNLMSYVTWVFRSYFGMPRDKAERLMMQVHTQGRATVSRGTLEQMEADTQAMHGFGLWATVEPEGGGRAGGDDGGDRAER